MRRSVALLLVLVFLAASCLAAVKPAFSMKPVENCWASKAAMPAGGAVYGAAAVNGKIYAFGAYNYNGTTYYTSGKYDPAADTWSAIASMPTARIEFATAVYENRIYVIGGKTSRGAASLNDVEVYDPATNSWASKTAMPTARDSMQANVVNGKIYVVSGEVSLVEPHPGAVFSDATEVYDPETDTWASAAPIPNHVAAYASAVLDGKIYVIGGATEEPVVGWHAVNTTQIYDPAVDRWSFGADVPEAVESAVGCATDGVAAPKRVYVFAGFAEAGNRDLNQVYDPVVDGWAVGAKQGFYGEVAAINMGDLIYVVGGSYSELAASNPWGYTVNPEPSYNPAPPFPAVNYRYTPVGYGATEFAAPKIAVLSPEGKEYSSGNVSVVFTVDEPTGWMGYRLDAQQVATITGNTTLNDLVSGVHNITLYAEDVSGNSGASGTISFTVAEEQFPTMLVAAVSVVAVILAAGLLLYFKKSKRGSEKPLPDK